MRGRYRHGIDNPSGYAPPRFCPSRNQWSESITNWRMRRYLASTCSSCSSLLFIGERKIPFLHFVNCCPRAHGNLSCACATPHEMQNEKNQAHNEQKVNQSRADVKCEKTHQPENNQYQSD